MSGVAAHEGVVLAGIDGPVRGGGVELALTESGIDHGLVGVWGGTARLPRVVGDGVAMDRLLSGRVLDAAEAREVGLLSRVVEDPRAVTAGLLDSNPRALRTEKRRIGDTAPVETQTERETEAFADLVERRG